MGVTYNANFDPRSFETFFDVATRVVARKVSAKLKENVKLFIPKSRGDAVGQFKGWEASGTLHSSIVVGSDKKLGDRWKAKVRVEKGSRANIYAAIHESGGFITANTPGGMWFVGRNPQTEQY